MTTWELLGLRTFPQWFAANDTVLVAIDFLLSCIRKPFLHVVGDLAIPSEGLQALRQLPCHLNDVRHHVDWKSRGVLHKEGQHEDQKDCHTHHVACQLNVEQIDRLSWPSIVKPQVYHVDSVFAKRNQHHGSHGQGLEEDPSEEC